MKKWSPRFEYNFFENFFLSTLCLLFSGSLHADCLTWFNTSGVSPTDPKCISKCLTLPTNLQTFDCGSECENFCRAQDPCKASFKKDKKWLAKEINCLESCLATQVDEQSMDCDRQPQCKAFCKDHDSASTEDPTLDEICKTFLPAAKKSLEAARNARSAFADCGSTTKSVADLYSCAKSTMLKEEKPPSPQEKTYVLHGTYRIKDGIITIYSNSNPLIRKSTIAHEKQHQKAFEKLKRRFPKSHGKITTAINNVDWRAKDEVIAYTRGIEQLEEEIKDYEKKCNE